ncbi:MAG: thioredoxin-disulfide reductase [Bacteroidales bacterium]|nr:MAG: thioredoxin-disulfide reductase [Bacteroidales bacterium]
MGLFKPLDNLENDKKELAGDQEAERVKCLIIGSGPAGYTAAIYAARANLKPVLYEGLEPGGQLTTTTEVENYPGYPEGITGPKMMEDFKKQAERFGTKCRSGIATSVDLSSAPYEVTIDDKHILMTDALIIATGATARYLGLESEEKFKGSGVSACATCDGFFYKEKDVAVTGGGDSACEEALYLAGLCRKVYMIIRKDHMRASKIMQERVFNTPNIEVLFERNTKELRGKEVLEEAVLTRKKGEPDESEEVIKIDGFFLAIGHTPNSQIFKDYIETDDLGYIKTIPGTSKTNIPGVFACGDIQDPAYRQAVTAAGSGCQAAIDAERYLAEKGI